MSASGVRRTAESICCNCGGRMAFVVHAAGAERVRRSMALSRPYRSATHGRATTARCACGKISRMARIAGKDMTASPSQLVARTRIFETEEGLKSTASEHSSQAQKPGAGGYFRYTPNMPRASHSAAERHGTPPSWGLKKQIFSSP